MRTKPWFVYVLRCGDGSLYTGATNDVAARLLAHRAGRGARYTRNRGPLRLVYRERCGSRSAALKREWALKQLTRPEKLRLIAKKRTRKRVVVGRGPTSAKRSVRRERRAPAAVASSPRRRREW